jgi:hypothetical protein
MDNQSEYNYVQVTFTDGRGIAFGEGVTAVTDFDIDNEFVSVAFVNLEDEEKVVYEHYFNMRHVVGVSLERTVEE